MLHNIQILRALSAYLVVFYHTQSFINGIFPDSMTSVIGAIGVDIFFIISGFVMVYTTNGQDRGPLEFWRDRAVRIIPLYWLATFLMVALTFIGLSPWGLQRWDMGDLFASLLFFPNVRADGSSEPILTPGWTLILEMFFYFLFGFGLLIRKKIVAVAMISLLFLGFLLIKIFNPPASFVINYYMNPITLEFAVGCILALVYVRSDKFRFSRPGLIALILFVIALANLCIVHLIELDREMEQNGIRLLVLGFPAFLIVTAALVLQKCGTTHLGKFLLLQGAASYALYLFHPVLIQSALKIIVATIGQPSGIPVAIVYATAAVIFAGVGGTMIHLVIERPLTGKLRAFFIRRRGFARPRTLEPAGI